MKYITNMLKSPIELISPIPPNEYSYIFCSIFEVSLIWINFPVKVCWLSSSCPFRSTLPPTILPCPTRRPSCPQAFGWFQPMRDVAGEKQMRVFISPAPPPGISLWRPAGNPLQAPSFMLEGKRAPHYWYSGHCNLPAPFLNPAPTL